MPTRERIARIFTLALPIIGGMLSQNVMNLVDTAMVGRLGTSALAAVGIASFANFVSQAFIMGLATGVQAMAARRMGEKRFSEQALPLNGGLLLAASIGLPISLLLFSLAPSIFPYLNEDATVIEQGVPYWQARLTAVAAVGMNFAFRGYWNGVNLSRLYMRTLIAMHILNIVLSYGLIFGKLGLPAMGTLGAGLGTALATWAGTATYFVLGWRHARKEGFLSRMPQPNTLRRLLRLSLPTGIQQLFFASGMLLLSKIVGMVGTAELAASHVLIQLMLVAILPCIGFGLSAASLVGQALGRKDTDDAAQWGWDVAKVGAILLVFFGLPMVAIPDAILSILTDDATTRAVARLPLQIFAATAFIEALRLVLQHCLLGAGDTRRVMLVSVGLQWGFFLPAAYLIGPVMGYGLDEIWVIQVFYSLFQASLFALMWKRRRWASIDM